MFVHRIDPIFFSALGVHFWWYGLSYSLGFVNAHLFLRRNRARLELSLCEVYNLTLFLAVGVLVGGRSLVVFSNEWPFYREHVALIPAIWLGGLATHGLIIGGFTGVLMFSMIYRKPLRPMADALAIPAALILGCGRIGNFIDGQIVGAITDVPWAVQFPEAEGFRHPVVLYDGLKNFLLIPLLLWVRRRGVPPGRLAALFVLLYPALRIPIDLLREYPISTLGLPTGQTFNIMMSLVGAALLVRNFRRRHASDGVRPPVASSTRRDDGLLWQRLAFAAILLVALLIPSDATRDVPALYAARHPGLEHSAMYPRLNLEPRSRAFLDMRRKE
jgi:phosphatidylglycerol:prolipoprotein diacylglycerol transferase